jgi:starch phosphorylase
MAPGHRHPIDPESMFVVQIKRFHEYKRQLLACLEIVHRYARIKRGEIKNPIPRTYLFAGKAAPGYAAAKEHIHLIHDIAALIDDDAAVWPHLRVVFVPNYGVSLAERIVPAADLSVQISLAGYEASGTGNMKLGMNGALTIGTLDGANVEIRDKVGAESFFLFGMDAQTALDRKRRGYEPEAAIAASPALTEALGLIEKGFFSPGERERYRGLVQSIRKHDSYMCCADFDDYVRAQDEVSAVFAHPASWGEKVVRNVANLGDFSSDRTILGYAKDIWGVERVAVEVRDDD